MNVNTLTGQSVEMQTTATIRMQNEKVQKSTILQQTTPWFKCHTSYSHRGNKNAIYATLVVIISRNRGLAVSRWPAIQLVAILMAKTFCNTGRSSQCQCN